MDKIQYTKIFLKQAGLSTDAVNVKIYLQQWWFNTARSSGLRLSNIGFKFLTQTLNLTAYEIVFPKFIDFNTNIMVLLSKHMDCPYILNMSSIVVFSERKCTELTLYNGDLVRYLFSKSKR